MNNTVYLIDYENVSYKGLFGISNVKPNDEIVVFYSNDISIIKDIVSVYEKLEISIRYFQLEKSGKNALDFMISAYAGYISSNENISRIAVISNDKGYLSISSLINALRPSVELLFDCCIYNIVNPNDKKDITFISCDNNTSANKVKTENTLELKNINTNVTKESVKTNLKNHIPQKYLDQTVVQLVKNYNADTSSSNFKKITTQIFGSKNSNIPYRNYVNQYFEILMSAK